MKTSCEMFGFCRKCRISSATKTKIILSAFSFFLGYTFHLLIVSNHEINNDSKSYLISIPSFKKADTFLIILIFSSINNFSKRQSLRDTWVSDVISNPKVKHYFVISMGNAEKEQENLISIEQNNFNDLLIFPNLDDTFLLLTSKLLTAFEWVVGTNPNVSTNLKPFANFNFLLKCDDDSFVRVNEILLELHTKFLNEKGKALYWGFFDGRARVKNSGKYKEVEWKICDYYIPYALGGGYVLSQSLVQFIAKNNVYLKKYKNEDVSVGAWLASYSNIYRFHDPRFDTEYISRGCHQSYLITHKHSESAIRNFYNNLKNLGRLCQKEFKTRMSYMYNWEVVPSKCCSRVNPNVP